jgi:hypothetical protein
MPTSLTVSSVSLAVVAEPDLRERARCLRILAIQTPLNALGVGSWDELQQAVDDALWPGLLLYSWALPGAPADAVAQLVARGGRVVVAHDHVESVSLPAGTVQIPRPVAEEALVQIGRAAAVTGAKAPVTFATVEFVQMICNCGESHVVIVSDQEGADAGVIEIRVGEIWTAIDGLGAGEDAFARLIRPGMRARVGRPGPSAKARTISKPSHELVLDSMRRFDEGAVTRAVPLARAQLEAILGGDATVAERIRQVNDEARRLLAARNYDEAARVLLVLSELDPASTLARANLEQLRRLGYPR